MSSLIQIRSADTILAKRQFFESIKDRSYRFAFVPERVRSSVALQIRALREQRNHMTQQRLGETLGMAQTWVSKLENPDYGKMSVATLLRLAEAFDTDLEIKFRPFSTTIDTLPTQDEEYFQVPSFDEEAPDIEAKLAREEARFAALGERGKGIPTKVTVLTSATVMLEKAMTPDASAITVTQEPARKPMNMMRSIAPNKFHEVKL